MAAISCDELVRWQGTREFTLLDVRLQDVREQSPATIAGAIWKNPATCVEWSRTLKKDEPIVVFCAHGRSVSQSTAQLLQQSGLEAYYLDGGLAAWLDSGRIVIDEPPGVT